VTGADVALLNGELQRLLAHVWEYRLDHRMVPNTFVSKMACRCASVPRIVRKLDLAIGSGIS
jgi:hypothetical protein